MQELNMCDKIGLLTDEYFHGELSPENKKILEDHVKSCDKCAEFFESEKIYFENIKSAEFIPEINIAESVMNIIISEQRTVDKPAKKRFVPFGLISAAAIVLVIFIASRDTLNLFENKTNDSAGSIKIEENAENIMLDGDFAENYINEAGGEAEVFAMPQIRAAIETDEKAEKIEMFGANIEESANELFNTYNIEEVADNFAPAPVAEEPAPAAEAPAPAMETAEPIPAPSEIIKIKRGEAENFDFTEYIFIGESIFITKEYKDAIIEDLKIYGIYYEIENTGNESEYIEIIYID